LGSAGILAGSLLFIDFPALGALQSVSLKVEGLVIRRDASVTDAHVANVISRSVFRTQFFGQVVRHF
jgi:hypothetical protein